MNCEGRERYSTLSIAEGSHEHRGVLASRVNPPSKAYCFVVFLTSSLIYAACQWGVLIVLARAGHPAQVGTFSYALAFSAPVVMFSRLNMRTALATDRNARFTFEQYFWTRLTLVCASLPFLLALSAARGHDIELWTAIAGVALFKSIESISDILQGRLHQKSLIRRIGLGTSLRGVTLFVVISVAAMMSPTIIPGVAAVSVAWLLILVLIEWPRTFQKRQRNVVSARPSLAMIKMMLPSGFVMLLASLSINVPTYVIESRLGISAVGFYGVVAQFLAAGGLIMTALAQASTTEITAAYHSGRNAYLNAIGRNVAISAALGVTVVLFADLFGEPLLWILYGQEYEHLSELLVLIAIAMAFGFLASTFGLCITVARRFSLEMLAQGVSCAAVATVAYLWVPVLGVDGGGWALVAGAVVRVVLFIAIVIYDIKCGMRLAINVRDKG